MKTMYEQIVKLCPIGVAIVIGDTIHDANDHGAKLLEYLPEEMIGAKISDLFVDGDTGVTKSGRRIKLDVQTHDSESGALQFIIFETRDSLTEAMTREQFFKAVQHMEDEYSILFIDLNKFKAVNDNLGHLTGDFVLSTVAKRIQHMIRGTDLLCRYGGDEFVIAVPGPMRSGIAVSKKVQAVVKEPMRFRNNDIQISCSVGMALSIESTNINDLISIADIQMYKHKEETR